jgi:hypothetical protein
MKYSSNESLHDIRVDVDGHEYGGQFVVSGDVVTAYYAGTICGKQVLASPEHAEGIADSSIRHEVRRRIKLAERFHQNAVTRLNR